MTGVVDQGGNEVVGGGDGVEVAGKVQVHGFHRQHLRVAAASGTAFHAEDRTEGGFAKRENGLLTESVECLSKSDGCGRLAGTGGHAGGGSDENQLGVSLAFRVEGELGLVPAIRFKFVVFQSPLMSEVVDTLEFGALSNFNVGQHRNVTPKKLKDKKVKKLIVVFVLQVQGRGKKTAKPPNGSKRAGDKKEQRELKPTMASSTFIRATNKESGTMKFAR